MDSKRNVLISIVLAVIALLVLGLTMFQKSAGTYEVSPETAYLTLPVTSFSGIVEKIDGNTVTVSRDAAAPQDSAITTVPLPQKKLTYKITVTSQTRFNRMVTPADYEQKTGLPMKNGNPGVADLKKDQLVSVTSSSDLRFLKKNAFTATSIELPALQKSISGRLEKTGNGTLTIATMPTAPDTAGGVAPGLVQTAKRTIYISPSVKVVKNTYIIDPASTPKPESGTVEAIPPGTQVSVYLKNSAEDERPEAVYIEYSVNPAITPAAPQPTPGVPTGTPVFPAAQPSLLPTPAI